MATFLPMVMASHKKPPIKNNNGNAIRLRAIQRDIMLVDEVSEMFIKINTHTLQNYENDLNIDYRNSIFHTKIKVFLIITFSLLKFKFF